jgi:hypothetical protein
LKEYFTGKPCKHGHVVERNTNSGQCVICRQESSRNYKEKLTRAYRVLQQLTHGAFDDIYRNS